MAVPVALVAFIVDDSGSMRASDKATREAFNAYVDVLKKTKGAEISLTVRTFRRVLQESAPIQDSIELTGDNYRATHSNTPLWRTITSLIESLDAELAKSGPRKVVVCVQTDGGDPESHVSCANLVRERMAAGWEFVWMGTGNGTVVGGGEAVSPLDGAVKLGIPKANQILYGRDSAKTLAAFTAAGWNVGSYASGRKAHADFTEDQRRKIG